MNAEDLLIQPFRDVIALANTAIANAGHIRNDDGDKGEQMTRAARALAREGERGLNKVQTTWESQLRVHGAAFRDMMLQQASIENRRLRLEDLLWDFDDAVHPEEFSPERYSALQAATKALALDLIETARRTRPMTPKSPSWPLGGFPPLPPLPPVSSRRSSGPASPNLERKNSTATIPACPPLSPPLVAASSPSSPVEGSQTRFSFWSGSSDDTLPPGQNDSPLLSKTATGDGPSISKETSQAKLSKPSRLMDCEPAASGPDFDPVLNDHTEARPRVTRLVDCAIGLSSTHHRLGGICRGAKRFRDEGWDSVIQTSEYSSAGGGSGEMLRASDGIIPLQFEEVTKVGRCSECMYSHDLDEMEVDMSDDASGTKVSESGAEYRLRLLYKSHLRTANGSEARYACLWCVQTGTTVREGDATVFLSADRLMRHLAGHPQPLPDVSGVCVRYGELGSDHGHDVHLPDAPIPVPMPDGVARLSRATATKDHYRRPGRGKLDRPPKYDGEMLEFLVGAVITGVMFPEKWDGKWCLGRHDGHFGAFPTKAVEITPPQESEIPTGSGSGMSVTARWKWPPSESSASGGPWLQFGKGETISNVECVYADYWCWSGTNRQGKSGVFPRSHIDLSTLVSQAKKAGKERRGVRGFFGMKTAVA